MPNALLNGFRRDCSGVTFRSSVAKSNESMLNVLSDIPQAEFCRIMDRGVAETSAAMYFSCSKEDVLSEEVAVK